jgi:23S rRNA pseudouridine1911/1915/1917 synthase
MARLVPAVSRTRARQLIAAGSVFIDGRRCRVASRVVRAGEHLRVETAPLGAVPVTLRILYEDTACIAVDKPPGMPTAPTRQAAAGSVLEELRRHLRNRDGEAFPLWVVHRLDIPASGVLLLAKTRAAAARLGEAFRRQRVGKVYWAWVAGAPPHDSGVVDLPIHAAGQRAVIAPDGRPARTQWRVLRRGGGSALLELRLETGRMHQARVHLHAVGYPILGDVTYGGPPAPRLMLHAAVLVFPHPDTGAATTVRAPIPTGFEPVEASGTSAAR